MARDGITLPGPRLLARHRRDLSERIGKQIVVLREEAGVTQAELRRCAGLAQSYLSEIESGHAQPTLRILLAIGHCLGADLSVRFFPGSGPRIVDRFQAPMVEALLRILGSHWRAQPEVPVAAARGVLDLVLRRRDASLVVACECHSELRRLELVIRRLAEKADALPGQVDGDVVVSRMLLLRSTAATRSIARSYEATLAAAFPARSADAVAALNTGGTEWPGPVIVWARGDGGRTVILDGPPRGVRVGR
jgi:transcriptional regulator with XRE-family HTH domain